MSTNLFSSVSKWCSNSCQVVNLCQHCKQESLLANSAYLVIMVPISQNVNKYRFWKQGLNFSSSTLNWYYKSHLMKVLLKVFFFFHHIGSKICSVGASMIDMSDFTLSIWNKEKKGEWLMISTLIQNTRTSLCIGFKL